jgi:hypothetical protein
MTGFENVGIFIREKVWLEPNSDAGELPRRKHTTIRIRRKFEIKYKLKLSVRRPLQHVTDAEVQQKLKLKLHNSYSQHHME